MSDITKIGASHLNRAAYVYLPRVAFEDQHMIPHTPEELSMKIDWNPFPIIG
jgi:hypothetical protein